MADRSAFPQIPSTVWWGVRNILQRTPTATVDERMLSVQLQVQEAAARQYIVELKRAGILTEESKATPLAQKWRLDQTYGEAVDQIVTAIYPEGLLHVAPPGDADRQKVVNWFLHEGLGQGAAGNKAATYLLISSREPNEAPGRSAGVRAKPDSGSKRSSRPPESKANVPRPQTTATHPHPRDGSRVRTDAIPLNVNVQIHISADAGAEQIETIFAAMRRYLHDDSAP